MQTLPALSTVLVTCIVMAGCAVGPRYAKPVTPHIDLASTQKAQFRAESVQAPWWTFFDDEPLTQWINMALAHNHDIRRAQANLLASRTMFDERNLGRYPAVITQAELQRNVGQQSGANGEPVRRLSETYRGGFDVQWEIDLFGRLNRMSQSARARAEAANAELDLVRLTIAAEVAWRYYERQGLQRSMGIAQAQVQSWRETLSLIHTAVELGSGLPEDQENAKASLLRSEAAIPPILAAIQEAQYRLDVLTGRRPGQDPVEPSVPTHAAPLARQLPLGDVNGLIRNRPDVVQAERLLAASTEDVGAATADLYPRLNLGGFIGFFALRGADIGNASAFEIAPGVSWPVFPAHARARLRGSQARSESALARYEQSVLQAQEEVENAVTGLVQHQDRLARLLRSATHAAAASAIATKRYRAGAGSYLAVLENQRSFFQTQQELADAETVSYFNAIALYKALGWGQRLSPAPE